MAHNGKIPNPDSLKYVICVILYTMMTRKQNTIILPEAGESKSTQKTRS